MASNQLDFSGKVAWITGGGSGLGLEIARTLGARGCAVALTGRNASRLESACEALGPEVPSLAVPCDVREPHAVRRSATTIAAELGPIDMLVNNAAGNFVRPAEQLPERAFANLVDIVLNGSFNCSRAVGRALIEREEGGVILNVVATYAWTGGPGTLPSACAKAGVLAMTRTLAVEWARHGIRVLAVAPGPFDSSGAADRLWPSDELRERVRRAIPLGRFARREEVAQAAAWLLSAEADYVTGSCLTLDGGGWLGRGILGGDEIPPVPTVRRKKR